MRSYTGRMEGRVVDAGRCGMVAGLTLAGCVEGVTKDGYVTVLP